MTLLDAKPIDERKARLHRGIVISVTALVLLILVAGIAGFFSGHGWFFSNVPAEYKVNKFFAAVEAQDFPRAYGIWQNDPAWQQHPDKYKTYSYGQFQVDWSKSSDYGTIRTHQILVSRWYGSGIVLSVSVNGRKVPLFLWVERKSGAIGFSPFELQ